MSKASWLVFGLGALVHLGLLAYGLIQDKLYNLKYTDVDYLVYTQGASAMLSTEPVPGGAVRHVPSFFTRPSPYLRPTYRYTPLMGIFTLPNQYLGDNGGKAVFVLFSLITGYYMMRLLQQRQVHGRLQAALLALWLLNPVVIQVSTRGNADTILTALTLASFYFVKTRAPLSAGVCLGLAIHLKIYPALYAFPLLCIWNREYTLKTFWMDAVRGISMRPDSSRHILIGISVATLKSFFGLLLIPPKIMWSMIKRLSREQWAFMLSAVAAFVGLTTIFYVQYGWTFLYETYLYHFVRHDHRHNFSPFSQWATMVTPVRYGGLKLKWPSNLDALKCVQKIVQYPLAIVLSLLYVHEAPEVGLFGCTVIFVVFNSVSTAQYFTWYLAWFPLALTYVPRLCGGDLRKRRWAWGFLISLVTIWLLADLYWVYWSYQWEFRGRKEAFMGLFASTLIFSMASLSLLSFVLLNQKKRKMT